MNRQSGDRSMRILFVTNRYPTDEDPGSSPCIEQQRRALQQLGHRVDLVFIQSERSRWEFLKQAFRVFWLAQIKGGYDVVHAHYGYSGLVARAQFRSPVVVTYRGSDVLNRKERPVSRLVAALVDVNAVMTEEMRQVLQRPEAEIIPYGVDFDLFSARDRQEARRELGLPADSPLVLFPYHPNRAEKRFDLVERSIELLKQRFPTLQLITLFNKPPAVVAAHMAACDAMLLTSDREGAPVAVREAMASGLPVVSVPVGDVPELIAGTEGCYLAERNPEEIAAKLALVLANPRRTKGQQAVKGMSTMVSAARLSEIYQRLVPDQHGHATRSRGRPGPDRGGRDARDPRVLMLLENASYPRDSRVRQEAQALLSDGYRVSVIAKSASGQPRREVVDGVHVFRFPAPPDADGFLGYLVEYGYSLMAIFGLTLEVLFREGFDVIHAANPPDALALVAAPFKLLGKNFVFDHHDLAPEMYYARFRGSGNRLVHRILLGMERISCMLADRVIATNQSYRAMEMGRDGVAEDRITIVRNGPDLNRLQPGSAGVPSAGVGSAQGPALKTPTPSTASRKTVLGYVGVTAYQDGVDHLIRALHHLAHDLGRTDFTCLVIGDGQAMPELRSLCRDLGIEDHVQFKGWVPQAEIGEYLDSTDICVSPEPSNPYNDRSTVIKLMEYMAMGKPIVSFGLPEHRYTAQGAALYATPNDEMEFARAIARLMDDPGLRDEMGAVGRRRVETDLAWKHSVPALLGAYRALFPLPNSAKLMGSER